MSVLIDNRSGPVGRMSVGTFERAVNADATQRVTFPYWPHCPEAEQVRWNGEVIAQVQHDKQGVPLTILFDPSGSHCYRRVRQSYGSVPLPYNGRSQTTLKAERVRTLEEGITDFLTPLPDSQFSPNGVVQRTALEDVACNDVK